jgi:hypothetical protein
VLFLNREVNAGTSRPGRAVPAPSLPNIRSGLPTKNIAGEGKVTEKRSMMSQRMLHRLPAIAAEGGMVDRRRYNRAGWEAQLNSAH